MADAWPAFTPVHLITGFLGSGKTTLLQRLLRHPALVDTAVLINEFGEIGLDHHLLERIDERTVLLQSGCLCCTIRGELAQAVRDLHARREAGAIPPFRRLVIESTGLADPFPILTTIHSEPVLKHHFRLGSVITTVDAVNAPSQIALQDETRRQIAAADCIVFTKTDLTDAAAALDVFSQIGEINPAALTFDGRAAALDVDGLLAGNAVNITNQPWAAWQGPGRPGSADSHHGHAHGRMAWHSKSRHGDIAAISLAFERPVDWTAFGVWLTMLLHRHGQSVLRVKGILAVEGSDTPVAVHGVQHLVHAPVHLAAWPEGFAGQSRLVLIVRALDPALIRRSLAAFGIG